MLAALVVVVVAVYAVRSLTHERVAVRVAQAAYGTVIKNYPTNGKVEPLDDFQAHAQVAGQVQDIYVDVGDKVKAGQLLLKMDDKYALANLAHAQSTLQAANLAASDVEHGGSQDERNTYAGDLNRARLQREQDATTLATDQKLLQQGAVSPAEITADQHRIEVDDSSIHSIEQHSTQRYGQADLARAQAELADARAAVAAAQSSYANADIRTPIAGTVYYLPVSQYDYVAATPGDNDLVYVADLRRMQVTAYFDEPDIGSLAAGQLATITWEAKPGMVWHGHITLAPTTIISYGTTRNVGECLISVDDADGVLQPNASVNVTVTTAEHQHVLTVPRESVHTEGSQSYVFRVVNNKLIRTPVQVGLYNTAQEEILSGLKEGDTVALNAAASHDLSDGLDVAPVQ